jgi:hypothetical protein
LVRQRLVIHMDWCFRMVVLGLMVRIRGYSMGREWISGNGCL